MLRESSDERTLSASLDDCFGINALIEQLFLDHESFFEFCPVA